MNELGILTLAIFIANGFVTYRGLKDFTFFNDYSFKIRKILSEKDYKRLFTSGFLHVNWTHFLFNMLTLYFFSKGLEAMLGFSSFFLIYFGSLIGGNLFALYIHRNHIDYSAVGASGAISGLVFASIGIFPGMGVGFLFLPISIPGWLFGIAYVGYSIYGIKSQRDNIGHEAHLGGGIVGLIIAVLLRPSVLQTNLTPIFLIIIPAIIFLYLILKKPYLIMFPQRFTKIKNVQSFEDKYNSKMVSQQTEIDKLLDKINRKGYENLSKKDQEKLKNLTK